jgi:hypothetical protein
VHVCVDTVVQAAGCWEAHKPVADNLGGTQHLWHGHVAVCRGPNKRKSTGSTMPLHQMLMPALLEAQDTYSAHA